MDVREKLVGLLSYFADCYPMENRHIVDGAKVCEIADHLIANGVTVQEWIPVTERMADKDGDYLVFKRFAGNAWSDVVSFAKDGRKVSECAFGEKWQNVWYYYDSEWGYIRTDAVTHWMPLPQPPQMTRHTCGTCRYYDPVSNACFFYAEVQPYGNYYLVDTDEEACSEYEPKEGCS